MDAPGLRLTGPGQRFLEIEMNTLTGTALLISGLTLGGPAFATVTVALNAFSVSLGGQFAVAA